MLFIILFASLNIVLAKPSIVYTGKIVNGRDVSITELPYQASVLLNLNPFCGGSIVSNHIVLTAAHCTYGHDRNAFTVHVGDTSVLEVLYGQLVPVKRIIEHEEYDPVVTNNDVSLLILSRPLIFSSRVQPITLDQKEPPVGAMATVSGWGTVSEGGLLSRNLQKVDVPIFERYLCNALYVGGITNKMFCAGYLTGYYDSCQGDSGGPLALHGKLIGVVSFGNGCARPFAPGVYASVSSLYNWLQTNINAN